MLSIINIKFFTVVYALAHMHPLLDAVLVFCALYLPYVVIIAVSVYLFFHNHNRNKHITFESFIIHSKEFALVVGTALVAWSLSALIKYNIEVARPFLALPIDSLLTHGGLDSFLSGHAAFFMALAAALFYYHKRAAMLVAVSAILIGIARIAVGVHFPFDIIAGWLLGITLGILVYRVWMYIRARFFKQENIRT